MDEFEVHPPGTAKRLELLEQIIKDILNLSAEVGEDVSYLIARKSL